LFSPVLGFMFVPTKTYIMQKKQTILNALFAYAPGKRFTVDKRYKAVKNYLAMGFTEKDLLVARMKRSERAVRKSIQPKIYDHKKRVEFLKLVNECEFDLTAQSSRYNCTGIDWKAFHRPTSNGIGWVCIAPDEPANNAYTEDPTLVKFLSKKFLNK
jgi:hypothetical protein